MGTAAGVSIAVALLCKGSTSGWVQGDFRVRTRARPPCAARDGRYLPCYGLARRHGPSPRRLRQPAWRGARALPDEEAEAAAGSEREAELEAMKVADLKELCRGRSLKVGGRKADLVARLVEHEAKEEDEEDSSGHSSDYDDEEEDEEPEGPVLSRKEKWMEALDKDAPENDDLEALFDIRMPQPGEVVTGIVTSLVEWGAFVEVDDSGWSGLIHISEVSGEFVDSIEDHLQPGQTVEALVIRSPQDRLDRLALSLRRMNRPEAEVPAVEPDLNPADPRPVAQYPPAVQQFTRSKQMEDDMRRLERRLNAVEAVLIQMGYGGALESARREIEEGTRKPAVPEWSLFQQQNLIDEEPDREEVAREAERMEIDAILADLMPQKDEGGEADAGSRGRRLVPTGQEELEFEMGTGMGGDDVGRRIMGDMF